MISLLQSIPAHLLYVSDDMAKTRFWSFLFLSFFPGPGAITNETSLFTYDTVRLLDEYFLAPKHDADFVPAFSFAEDPDDPLYAEMTKMCSGPGSWFCKYDVLASRSLKMGNSTMVSYNSHTSAMRDLEPGTTCSSICSLSLKYHDFQCVCVCVCVCVYPTWVPHTIFWVMFF